jgi:hypothetical protein
MLRLRGIKSQTNMISIEVKSRRTPRAWGVLLYMTHATLRMYIVNLPRYRVFVK